MTPKRRTELAGLCLALVTLALFWPVTTHDYIAFDDDQYASQNAHVTGGLSLSGIKWAFATTYTANWHPLTWLSLMLDCSVFGNFAASHHLTNILLHTLNTLLLFFLLQRMTKLTGRSFIVAALFGWHPAHVESVAWIAERKDVLSTLFFLLTLLAYARYAVEPQKTSPRKFYYALALVLFALGLMSKPMLVTLPFVLLLLDYWPLKRIAECGVRSAESENTVSKPELCPWHRILLEKLPFLAMAFAACVMTLKAQGTGAIRSVAEVPVGFRLLNALTSYLRYIGMAFWPAKLSIFYLLPEKAAIAPAVCSGSLLAAITYLAFRFYSRSPWLLFGWLWFLGTLVPVIGLVQVGSQALADRYTYIPLIGLFVAVVWGVDCLLRKSGTRAISAGLATVVLAACFVLTHRQLGFWHNNIALFGHAVEATPDNYFVQYEFGAALDTAGYTDEAVAHYSACLRLNPAYELAHYRLGLALTGMGKLDEAAFHFSEALKREPNSEELHNDLGVVFAQQGRNDAAIGELKRSIQINPAYPQPYINYGNILQKLSRPAEALTNYYRAQALEPDSPEVLDKIALLLATCPEVQFRNPPVALKFALRASELTQNQDPTCLAALATANAATGNFSNAIAVAEVAAGRARDLQMSNTVLELEHDLAAYRQNRPAGAPKEH